MSKVFVQINAQYPVKLIEQLLDILKVSLIECRQMDVSIFGLQRSFNFIFFRKKLKRYRIEYFVFQLDYRS